MTTEREDQLRTGLAEACWILAAEGHEHFDLGHASVRSGTVDGFWVKPAGLRLSEVTAHDLVLVDLEGRRLVGDAPLHLELPIHTEIYRRRGEVRAVIHTHPFHTAAFAASGARFEMVSQDSVLFAEGFTRFDSPQLISSAELGAAVAETLASGSVVVLRNHGLVVAAPSLEVAVVLAVSFERSLAVQLAATGLAGVVAMSADEATQLAASLETAGSERMTRMYRALRSGARAG